MIYIEMPLWVAILLVIAYCLMLLHMLFGDFIAKLLIKLIKEKENDKK